MVIFRPNLHGPTHIKGYKTGLFFSKTFVSGALYASPKILQISNTTLETKLNKHL